MLKYEINNRSINGCTISFSDIVSYKNDVYSSNKYNTSLTVEIISNNNYSGKSEFILDIIHLETFITDLLKMYQTLSGNAKLSDSGYGSFIEFKCAERGKIIVAGVLFDDHKEQELKFSFGIDQTYIDSFAKTLYKDIVLEKQQII